MSASLQRIAACALALGASLLVAAEGTRDLPTREAEIETPLETAKVRLLGRRVADAGAVDIDTLVVPEILPEPDAVEVLDGRTFTFKVFRQRGNQGGGDAIDRTVTEGRGNGNGVLEPGEEATVWVRLVQGMDAFDKNTWHRCKVYAESPWVTEVADIEEEKQREWTSARERTSLLRLSDGVPHGTEIPVLLSSESWSFHFTPDVRYGTLPLYQAFQLHTRHLHKYQIRVP